MRRTPVDWGGAVERPSSTLRLDSPSTSRPRRARRRPARSSRAGTVDARPDRAALPSSSGRSPSSPQARRRCRRARGRHGIEERSRPRERTMTSRGSQRPRRRARPIVAFEDVPSLRRGGAAGVARRHFSVRRAGLGHRGPVGAADDHVRVAGRFYNRRPDDLDRRPRSMRERVRRCVGGSAMWRSGRCSAGRCARPVIGSPDATETALAHARRREARGARRAHCRTVLRRRRRVDPLGASARRHRAGAVREPDVLLLARPPRARCSE